MDDKDKKLLIIVAAVIGGLGCCGVLGIVGLGFFGAAMAPTVAAPPTGTPVTAPAVPVAPAAGWTQYSFAANCTAGNPNLRLGSFQVAYPTSHTVLACTEQQPRPWAYVTFHHEGPTGAATSQWTVGYASGPVDFNLLAQAADDLSRQLNAGATIAVRQDQMLARGSSLLRRDSTFHVQSAMGTFQPGQYIYRQVVIPKPGSADGLMLTYVAATTNPQADFAANDADLQRVVESIVF